MAIYLNLVRNKPYRKAVLGGTFDRLHAAHESILHTAAFIAEEVFVGIVTEELGKKLFAEKEHAEMIQSYEKRAEGVKSFLNEENVKSVVGPLYDPWGPAPTDPIADVIVVSSETEKSAHIINEMRKKSGLDELDIVIIPWVTDQEGNLLSSTLIRKKELRDT